ncbi:DUF6660 family protein [Sinomicrobium oceani]|uniref:DUF6660 family protein n=1 Tax=Sinomicrobium oceani TaxID=1150368 RepID=UPI0038B5F487
MKILTIILSVYFLVLNVVPCDDSEVSLYDFQNDLQTQLNHNSDNTEPPVCINFCLCSCCHVNVVNVDVVPFVMPSFDISSEIFFHSDGFGKDLPLSLLQPPQV